MAKQFGWAVQVEGAAQLKRAMAVLAQPDTPYLKAGLAEAGELVALVARNLASRRISGTIAFVGVTGAGTQMKAVVESNHPMAKSVEFGRRYYYRKATAVAVKGSQRGRRTHGASKKGFGSYIGNNQPGFKRGKGSMRNQERYVSAKGLKARPYLGIAYLRKPSGPGAIHGTFPKVQKILTAAIEKEWQRLATGGPE